MMRSAVAARLARLEAEAAPAGRVRVFRLPREMSAPEIAAWREEHVPDATAGDLLIFIQWLAGGERPAEFVGEVRHALA